MNYGMSLIDGLQISEIMFELLCNSLLEMAISLPAFSKPVEKKLHQELSKLLKFFIIPTKYDELLFSDQ